MMHPHEIEEMEHGQSGIWAYGGLYATTTEAMIACGCDTPESLAAEEEFYHLRDLTTGHAFWRFCDCCPDPEPLPF